MKTLILSVLLFITIISHVSGQVDYCKLCAKHIACNNTGAFAVTCPPDAYIVPLTQVEKDAFLHSHNSLRNTLAGGLTPGFASAANISSVIWDDTLAYFAELNVRKCKMEHDSCRKTPKYMYAGQNLWIQSSSSAFIPIVTAAGGAGNCWYNEYKLTNQTLIKACCQPPEAGHFTQFSQYRVEAIGCAIARYLDPNNKFAKTTLVACNYSYGNLVGQPIYIPGPPASSCKNGAHPVYTNLCKVVV